MQDMSIWYPQGAGGMWVNYLVWCGKHNKVIPGNHQHFEYLNMLQTNGAYQTLVFMVNHHTPEQAKIRLSGPYYFNYYLNFANKKLDEYGPYFAELLVSYQKKAIAHNLDWGLIFNDQPAFIDTINKLCGTSIEYNEHTKTAFDQYQASCINPRFDDEFLQTRIWKDWERAVNKTYGYSGQEILDFTKQYTINF